MPMVRGRDHDDIKVVALNHLAEVLARHAVIVAMVLVDDRLGLPGPRLVHVADRQGDRLGLVLEGPQVSPGPLQAHADEAEGDLVRRRVLAQQTGRDDERGGSSSESAKDSASAHGRPVSTGRAASVGHGVAIYGQSFHRIAGFSQPR